MANSRKFILAIVGVAVVVALAVLGQVLKARGIDVEGTIEWAIAAIAALCVGSAATIAYEDSHRNGPPEGG